jgi:hypothetical protein
LNTQLISLKKEGISSSSLLYFVSCNFFRVSSFSFATQQHNNKMASTIICVPVPYGSAERTVNSISLRNQQAPSTDSFGTSLVTVWESDHSGVTGAGDGAFTIRGKYNNYIEMQVSQFTNGYQRLVLFFIILFFS